MFPAGSELESDDFVKMQLLCDTVANSQPPDGERFGCGGGGLTRNALFKRIHQPDKKLAFLCHFSHNLGKQSSEDERLWAI